MLTLNISEADIEHVKYERIHYPIARIRARFDALYLTSQGYTRGQVSKLTGLHRNTITAQIKSYEAGGLEQVKVLRWKGPASCLAPHEQSLETYFEAHPPRTTKQARAAITQITGETLSVHEVRRFLHKLGMKPRKAGHIPAKADPAKQEFFLHKQLKPLLKKAKAKKCQVFFVDAAHFNLLPLVSMIWSFTRIFIKAAAGRNRINVLGALDAVTLKVHALINTTYINADSVVSLFEMLRKNAKKNLPIYVVLDNARYQHCDFVKTWATALGIELVFLPPYSPNLNLIERLWKYIKKDILSNRYFESVTLFHEAVVDAIHQINHCPITRIDISSLLTHNFQTFAQKLTQ